MPNWCNNSLVLTHENPEMIAKAVAAAEAGSLCETFVPCPPELRETIAGANPRRARREVWIPQLVRVVYR